MQHFCQICSDSFAEWRDLVAHWHKQHVELMPCPYENPHKRRCSLCWEWSTREQGFIHDPRCMSCEGTGYKRD